VHKTVSPLTNRLLSVTGNRKLGFGREQYGGLFLAIAEILVDNWQHICTFDMSIVTLTAVTSIKGSTDVHYARM